MTQAASVLASTAPFSAGVAVGQLQDPVELFLHLLGDHFHAQIKEKLAFDQIIDAVNKQLPTPLSHRTALIQLNKARVNFKHHALEPRLEDARKLLHDVQDFLPAMSKAHLGVDFETLSLSSLVGHLRSENWLRKAEEFLATGDYARAVDAAAIALAIFQGHLDTPVEPVRLDRFGRYRHGEFRDLIEAVENEFHNAHSTLDLMLTGVNLAQFRLFRKFAPRVDFSRAGTFFLSGRDFYYAEPNREQATVCVSFAIDAILSIKTAHVPASQQRRQLPETKQVEVVAEANSFSLPEHIRALVS